MRYGIIVNPAAGQSTIDEKRKIIENCAAILGPETETAGWDTRSVGELRDCASDLASRVDVLVVAGGDGTFSDIINSVKAETVLAYMPMGSGNAWRNTLGLPRSIERITRQIRDGKEHLIDLVLCDEQKKGLLASVGIEGHALEERERYLEKGVTGFDAYFRATTKSILGGYRGEDATVVIDGKTSHVPSALSLIITKSPFYGYGLKVVPEAKLADGFLHVLLISGQQATALSGLVSSLFGGNRFGQYATCKSVSITTHGELHLQIDGTIERKGTDFKFRVLPAELRIRY